MEIIRLPELQTEPPIMFTMWMTPPPPRIPDKMEVGLAPLMPEREMLMPVVDPFSKHKVHTEDMGEGFGYFMVGHFINLQI